MPAKKKHKKAQMQSQMFIYLLTILIIGFLLFLGFKWIGGISKMIHKIDVSKLTRDMKSTFSEYKSRPGSWKIATFDLPDGITKVCFTDLSIQKTTIEHSSICTKGTKDYDALICDAWKDKTQNVFFFPRDKVESNVKIDYIAVPKDNTKGYVCFDAVASKLTIKVKGTGNKVEVSMPK